MKVKQKTTDQHLQQSAANSISADVTEEESGSTHHEELQKKQTSFQKFLEQANALKAKSVNLRKYKSILGSSYTEIVSIEEIRQIFKEVVKRLSFNLSSWKYWNKADTLIMIWLMEKYNVLYKKIQQEYTRQDWKQISSMLPGKTPNQCLFKWLGLFKNPLQKNPWTKQQNTMLCSLVQGKNEINWQQISQKLYLSIKYQPIFRSAKQCKEHYAYHLDPNIRKGHWNDEEDLTLLKLHLIEGNRWQKIAALMKGRTENAVKNRINIITDKHILPRFTTDIPLSQKMSAYITMIEQQKPVTKKQLDSINNDKPLKTRSFKEIRTKREAQPQCENSVERASNMEAIVQDGQYQTYATVNERKNVRCINFVPMSVEDLLREDNIYSAIFCVDSSTVFYKQIVLIEKQKNGLESEKNNMVSLIDYESLNNF